MRIFFVAVIFVIHATGTAPSTSIILRRANKGDRDPLLKQRDAIVESVFLPHPEWTSEQVFSAVVPLIKAAGLPPIKIRSLRVQLWDLAKKHKMKRAWGGMHPDHTAYLRDQLAKDPAQHPNVVWTQFQAVWGQAAEDPVRVKAWWRDTLRYQHRKLAGAAGSADQSDLPDDWWELGEEFNQYLQSDSSRAGTPVGVPAPTPPGPTLKPRPSLRGSRDALKQRNAIVESVYLANPTSSSSQIHKIANPLIVAAGFEPIGTAYVRQMVGRIKKASNTPPSVAKMMPQHTAFLKAQFANDPNQLANDIWAKFRASFGPDAESGDRVTTWWYNCRRRSLRKQAQPAHVRSRSGSPRAPSPLSVPRPSSPSRSPSRSVHRSASRESVGSGLPLDWWNIDQALDQFVDTPRVDANGVLLDPWADLTPTFPPAQ